MLSQFCNLLLRELVSSYKFSWFSLKLTSFNDICKHTNAKAQTQTLSKSMLIHKHKVTQVIGAQICTPMAHNNDL